MSHQIPEELISAYLDGELTSDEQLLVEEALRTEPQAQQLLDELQSLHDHLQSIPRSEPSQDYTQHILHRAERTILTGTSDPSSGPVTAQSPANPTVTLPAAQDSPGNWKHIIWASTALAATLLLALLLQPDEPISRQLTDATHELPKATSSGEQADPVADDDENITPMESQLESEESADFDKGDDLAGAGAMSKKAAPGAAIQLKNRPTTPFGNAKAAGITIESAADSNSPEDLFLFVSLPQKEFDQQTVVRTLLQQEVPFGYDPANRNGLSAANAYRYNQAMADEATELALIEQEKASPLADRKRNQDAPKDKASADGIQNTLAQQAANTRVVTIEASPEELEELVVNLSNQYQVNLGVEKYAASGFSQQATTRRQLDSPVNRAAVERIQALATQNTLQRASAARAPAGKPAAKPADTGDAKPLKTLPETTQSPEPSAKRDKERADQNSQTLDDSLAGSPRQRQTETLRVVVVIEANAATASALAARKAPSLAKKKSQKGWELYTWQEDEVTYFALLPGTNRLKTAQEIKDIAVKDIRASRAQLDQLQKCESVFLHGRRLNTKASATLTKQLTEYCKKIGLKTP